MQMTSIRRVTTCVTSIVLAGSVSAQDTARPAAAWPGLWGPSRTGTTSPLASPAGLAKNVWHRTSEGGYSEVAIAGQRIVTMDLRGGVDYVVALDANTGQDVWTARVGPTYRGHDSSQDGPIATPAIDGNEVFAVGPHGVVVALDLTNGRERWRHDLAASFGAAMPLWGFAASPLVEGQLVIVATGGARNGLLAFDRGSGALRWSALPGLAAGYSSAVAATLAGTRQVIVVRGDRVAAVSAADGRELWSVKGIGATEEILNSAVVLPEDRVLLTHAKESFMLRVARRDNRLIAEEVWRSAGVRVSMSPAVHVNGSLYAFSGAQLVCLDPANGNVRWRERTGDGTLAAAGTTLFLITRAGDLVVADASSDGYREVSRTRVFSSGGSTVTGPSIANGRLYARSPREIAAFSLDPPSRSALRQGGPIIAGR
jgi:outer membrane protein assembly factor BamB